MAKRGPTLRSQWLGKRLRDLRESVGLTLKDVAIYAQRDPSSISRMEAGIHPARVPDVLAYVSLCGVTDHRQREELIELAKDSWLSGWWDRYAGEYGQLVDRIWLESRATAIESFEAIVVPGHLQTRDYATAVIEAGDPEGPPEQRTRDVQLRMERKDRILSKPSLVVNVWIDESVLYRCIGGADAMRRQLLHLIELADRPMTQISVVPFAAGAHASLDGGFDVIRLGPPYSNVGYVYSPAGTVFLEGDEVDRVESRFGRLADLSLGSVESKLLMANIAKELH